MKIKEINLTPITEKIEAQLKNAQEVNHHYISFFKGMKDLHTSVSDLLTYFRNTPETQDILEEDLNTFFEEVKDIPGLNMNDLFLYILHYYRISGPKE